MTKSVTELIHAGVEAAAGRVPARCSVMRSGSSQRWWVGVEVRALQHLKLVGCNIMISLPEVQILKTSSAEPCEI